VRFRLADLEACLISVNDEEMGMASLHGSLESCGIPRQTGISTAFCVCFCLNASFFVEFTTVRGGMSPGRHPLLFPQLAQRTLADSFSLW
jgi:hypothetical protein